MKGTIVYKMTGSGNDFVLVDGRYTSPAEWPSARVVQLCDRRTGIGADGLVILTPERTGTVGMAFWNSDGTRAAMCGNAALCSTRLSVFLEFAEPGELSLITDAGAVQARCPSAGDQAEIRLPDFELALGKGNGVCGIEPVVGERWMAFATVGVPHLVIRVDDVEAVDVMGRGRSLRYDARLGSAGANVNFVAATNDRAQPWLIRTYERGVEGETLACGTGTVAAGLALAQHGEAQLPVRFRSRGGEELLVTAALKERRATNVWLGGQGKLVFKAVWEA
ncbi:MAG TPA: diaminopimelate epimerase [Gemmatimonadales bacterium]|nr:diaminopimelate epimerase [Gemmatimonadales bacterium]